MLLWPRLDNYDGRQYKNRLKSFSRISASFFHTRKGPSMDSDSSGLLDEVSATPAKEFFPMCIVWSPIPMLTWMLPVSGHLGMSDSSGLISDFAGTFHIHQNRKKTAFGGVTKFLPVKASDLHALPSGTSESAAIAAWNRAVTAANKTYEVVLFLLYFFFFYGFCFVTDTHAQSSNGQLSSSCCSRFE